MRTPTARATHSSAVLLAVFVVLAVLAGVVARADAQELTILRYERLVNFVSADTSAETSQGVGLAMSFSAFGTRFALTLASNDALTRSLPADVLRRLGSAEFYVGTLDGVRGSWVRLTRIDGELQGAIWDGAELYTIEPFERIAARVVAGPQVDTTESVIYRWADTLSPATDDVVFPMSTPLDKAATSQNTSTLKAVLAEVAALPTGIAPARMLDIGLLADAEFVQTQGTRAEALMLGVANTVDGIFADQVGVRIRVTDLRPYSSEPDAFSGTNARALLDQLQTVKFETLRDRGLVHLLTGRDLDEAPGAPPGARLLGISNLAALCDETRSASITQFTDSGTASLIAAHEIAHNFGAPHDGEAGACQSAPDGYLMMPFYNGSRQFSECSVQQMAAKMATASCLVPNPSFALTSAVVSSKFARPGELVDIDWTVVNQGLFPATDVRAKFKLGPGVDWVEMQTANGAVCVEDPFVGHDWTCPIGTVGAGATVAMKLRVRAQDWVAVTPGSSVGGTFSLTLVAAEPEFDYRNSWSVYGPIVTRHLSDIYAELTMPASAPVGGTVTLTLRGGNRGPDAVSEVGAVFRTTTNRGLTFVSATSSRGTCRKLDFPIRCDFGTLAAGDKFEMVVQATAGPEGEHEVEAGAGGIGTFDTNIEDNSRNQRFVAGNPPPPAPAPSAPPPTPATPSAATGGGGGGGSVDLALLLLLASAAVGRIGVRRRTTGASLTSRAPRPQCRRVAR